METTQETRTTETASNDMDKLENRKNDNSNQLDGAGDSAHNSVSEDNQFLKNHPEETSSNAEFVDVDDSDWETEEEIDISDISTDDSRVFNNSVGSSRKQKPHSSPGPCKKKSPRHAAILQLKITLKDYKPKIWRRILVSNLDTFEELHNYIQLAMGWWDCHLHQFTGRCRAKGPKIQIVSGHEEEEKTEQFLFFQELMGVPVFKTVKESKTQLFKFLHKQGDLVEYMYDFGDGWAHKIVVEKVLPYDSKEIYPQCIGGERACPPEDCGGVYGYKRLLEVRANPEHADYNDLITDWLDDFYPDFDPDKFEPDLLGFY